MIHDAAIPNQAITHFLRSPQASQSNNHCKNWDKFSMNRTVQIIALLAVSSVVNGFVLRHPASRQRMSTELMVSLPSDESQGETSSRRTFLATSAFVATAALMSPIERAEAIGPVKINLKNPRYTARPCPKDKPIPGEKAMKGMVGLCVTVEADLEESPPRDLDKAGVYGFVTYDDSGESVLANNPDLSTDAGQFAMIESVKTTDKKTKFEFVAAIPKERDVSQYENGIGNLQFGSLRLINFPGGNQFGAISPCEMDEFSEECEAWESENGAYKRGEYMIQRNPRTRSD